MVLYNFVTGVRLTSLHLQIPVLELREYSLVSFFKEEVRKQGIIVFRDVGNCQNCYRYKTSRTVTSLVQQQPEEKMKRASTRHRGIVGLVIPTSGMFHAQER